ncbi:peptidoglycan DD-metalloendopeptidase family protein [Vogesella oryzae]|uniref:peptidoglycan DD-metalloendopeptidase family protein n=1 Tax=Vogesella oryzae TaxID=1735285 RepID=UPI001FEBBA5E|nr:peptidoglycan DD-metalloendopeptidase family protein [Vogesella oryzae]
MQGKNATPRSISFVRQFTLYGMLAYKLTTMHNNSLTKKITRFSPLLGALLLSACAQLQQDTPAQIVRGQPSVLGSASQSQPAAAVAASNGSKATTQAMAIGGSLRPRAIAGGQATHTVQPGETVYRIAVNNGLRYQDLAEWNNLEGFNIKVGQVLRLTPPGTASASAQAAAVEGKPIESRPATGQMPASAKAPSGAAADGVEIKRYPKALKLPYSEEASKSLPALSEGNGKTASPAPVNMPATVTATPKTDASASVPATDNNAAGDKVKATGPVWGWPTQGSVIRGFSDQNKGLDIGGKAGQPVVAAADGKVVYSGNGLRGYGKLIILRHDKTFLSAYAHNSQLLVKEGQTVKKGQKIAEMGSTDTDQVKLHFEIRQLGKPVDPSKYLEQHS